MYATTHPTEPDIPTSSPEVTKIPIPTVPENAMAMIERVSFCYQCDITQSHLPAI